MPCKMSNEELVKSLVENRKNENGDLDLSGLHLEKDFHNVYINELTVKGNLCQDHQTVGGNLCQHRQTVKGGMVLQSHDGLEEDEGGFWCKKKTLAERINDLNIDGSLKAEILANLKEGK